MTPDDLLHLSPVLCAALCQLMEACQRDLPPRPARCPACTITHAAERIVNAVQPGEPPAERWAAFPRQPLEQDVLEILRVLSPLPVTTGQVASLVDTGSYRQVRTILQALAQLRTIEHPRQGVYRHPQRGQ